ncbi:hypothetical protein ABT187_30460 [Streptomyces sp. NPDC001817]|uniref:hypothetical protein n=1 Tax=Streptomyces sp. NPDC001817 TaxID=3154398 RepID=UPI0033193582
MDVLLCAACGHPLTEPVRRLDEIPGFPGRDGLPGPDGLRRPPAWLPRGSYAVDPLPYGAPFVPVPDDEEYDGVVPGGKWMSDERGCGPDGEHGVNRLCSCGAEVAIVAADRTSEYSSRFVPDAVRAVPA